MRALRLVDLVGHLGVTRCYACHQTLPLARPAGVAPGFCSAECQSPWARRTRQDDRTRGELSVTARIPVAVGRAVRAFPGGTSTAVRAAVDAWRGLAGAAQREVLARSRGGFGQGVRIVVVVDTSGTTDFRAEVAAFGVGPSAALGRIVESFFQTSAPAEVLHAA